MAALDKRGRFVGASLRQPTLLSACRPQQDRAEPCGGEAGDDRELFFDFAAQFVDALTHAAIDLPEFFLHHPKRRIVSAAQLLHFSLKALTDAWIGVVLVASPTHEHGLAHSIETRSISLEIAPERPIQ